MNPISPWLDPVELRRLAEKLIAPVGTALDPPAGDPGFEAEFVGFTSGTQAPPATHPSPEPLPTQEPLPTAAAAPVAPDIAPTVSPTLASGPFLERIHRFRDWLHRHFAATGVFILDRAGAVIFDESGHGNLHYLARSLAHTTRRPGSPSGDIHLKIGAAATLEVIPAETAYGWLVLGAVVPAALSPPAVALVIDAITQVAAPQKVTSLTGSAALIGQRQTGQDPASEHHRP